jgi:hypothetical protein
MQPWHFFLLLAMVGATWAVIEARHTHPAALILISVAILSAGVVAIASHAALTGFFSAGSKTAGPLSASTRQALEEEKALVLRSIKELEFDRAMRKVGDADFAELSARLRARAMDLMEQLERTPEVVRKAPSETGRPESRSGRADSPRHATCPSCRTENDADAKFCKNCGARLT